MKLIEEKTHIDGRIRWLMLLKVINKETFNIYLMSIS